MSEKPVPEEVQKAAEEFEATEMQTEQQNKVPALPNHFREQMDYLVEGHGKTPAEARRAIVEGFARMEDLDENTKLELWKQETAAALEGVGYEPDKVEKGLDAYLQSKKEKAKDTVELPNELYMAKRDFTDEDIVFRDPQEGDENFKTGKVYHNGEWLNGSRYRKEYGPADGVVAKIEA